MEDSQLIFMSSDPVISELARLAIQEWKIDKPIYPYSKARVPVKLVKLQYIAKDYKSDIVCFIGTDEDGYTWVIDVDYTYPTCISIHYERIIK